MAKWVCEAFPLKWSNVIKVVEHSLLSTAMVWWKAKKQKSSQSRVCGKVMGKYPV